MYATDIHAASGTATVSAPAAASGTDERLPSRSYAAPRAGGRPVLSLSASRAAGRTRALQLTWIGLIRR